METFNNKETMKKNILAENMRRFGTKNLSEANLDDLENILGFDSGANRDPKTGNLINQDADQNNNGYPDGTEGSTNNEFTDYQYESLVSWYYIENTSNYPGTKGRTIPYADEYDDPSKYEGTELYIPKGTKGYKEAAGSTSYFTDYEGNSVPFIKKYFKLNPKHDKRNT